MGELERFDVGGAFAAAAIGRQLIFDALVLAERAQTRSFESGNMDECVIAALIRSDEAKALGIIEEFDSTLGQQGAFPLERTDRRSALRLEAAERKEERPGRPKPPSCDW